MRLAVALTTLVFVGVSAQPVGAAEPTPVGPLQVSVEVTDDSCEPDLLRIDYAEGAQWFVENDTRSEELAGRPVEVPRPLALIPFPGGFNGRVWAEPLSGYVIPDDAPGSATNPYKVLISPSSTCASPAAGEVSPSRAESERAMHRALAKLRRHKRRLDRGVSVPARRVGDR
jgi:hypothetical protein